MTPTGYNVNLIEALKGLFGSAGASPAAASPAPMPPVPMPGDGAPGLMGQTGGLMSMTPQTGGLIDALPAIGQSPSGAGGIPMGGMADMFKSALGGGAPAAPAPANGPAPEGEILPWKVPAPERNPMRAPEAQGGGTGFADVLRAIMIGAGNADTSRSIGGSFVSGMGAGTKAMGAIEDKRDAQSRQKMLDAERADDKSYRRGRDSKLDALRADEKQRGQAMNDIKMKMAEIQLKDAERKLANGEQLTLRDTLRLAELDKDIGETVRKRNEYAEPDEIQKKVEEERTRIFSTYPGLQKFLKNGGVAAPAPVAPGVTPAAPAAAPATSATPSYQEGQTATGPNGQKVIFRNGQWTPAQ